jgi:hypothetical protein
VKYLLLSLLALCAAPAFAAPLQIQSCTIGAVAPYPQKPTGVAFPADLTGLAWVSTSASGAAPFCKKLTGVPNGFVSTRSGTTWVWGTVAAALAGTSTPTPTPPPVVGVATLTWTATTKDVTGAAITLPITYNVYRGTSSTSLIKIGTGAVSPYADKTVIAGTAYCWAVTAVDTNGESIQSNPPVCLTIATPPAANLPAAPASVTAK